MAKPGKKKSFAVPASRANKVVKKVVKKVVRAKAPTPTAFNFSEILEMFSTIKELVTQVVGLAKTISKIKTNIESTIEVQRASFMDTYKQYVETLSNADRVADPKEFLRLFQLTADALDIVEDDLRSLFVLEAESPSIAKEGQVTTLIPAQDLLDVSQLNKEIAAAIGVTATEVEVEETKSSLDLL